jgi:predicted GIY-YIG superfamily endonuclease
MTENAEPATMKEFYVYLMTNRIRVVLYTGVTSKLEGRVWQHKNHVVKGFTSKYKRSSRLLRAIFRSHFGNHARKRNQSLAA